MKYQKDYYQILGVKSDATQKEIKSAYRRLVILNHPDRNSSSQATARMQEINEAYDVVGDQNKRTKYDFAHRDSTPVPQTNASFYAETANLQEFSAKENRVLLLPGPAWITFFSLMMTVGVVMEMALFVVFPTLASWYMAAPLDHWVILLVGPLGLLGIIGAITFWISSKSSEKESQCPKCGRVWAAEELNEKLMGIFQKGYGGGNRSSEVSFIRRAKYKIHYKCKYCSFEWLFIKIKNV
jgi:hypothetical protein